MTSISLIQMSYQLHADDECQDCIHYTKPIHDRKQWKCVICELTEIPHYDVTWFRYELRCNHQVHARCYKKWCKLKKTVGCPQCGLLLYTETNMYCDICGRFGHSHQSRYTCHITQ